MIATKDGWIASKLQMAYVLVGKNALTINLLQNYSTGWTIPRISHSYLMHGIMVKYAQRVFLTSLTFTQTTNSSSEIKSMKTDRARWKTWCQMSRQSIDRLSRE